MRISNLRVGSARMRMRCASMLTPTGQVQGPCGHGLHELSRATDKPDAAPVNRPRWRGGAKIEVDKCTYRMKLYGCRAENLALAHPVRGSFKLSYAANADPAPDLCEHWIGWHPAPGDSCAR
jgi:hypothetical protein